MGLAGLASTKYHYLINWYVSLAFGCGGGGGRCSSCGDKASISAVSPLSIIANVNAIVIDPGGTPRFC